MLRIAAGPESLHRFHYNRTFRAAPYVCGCGQGMLLLTVTRGFSAGKAQGAADCTGDAPFEL